MVGVNYVTNLWLNIINAPHVIYYCVVKVRSLSLVLTALNSAHLKRVKLATLKWKQIEQYYITCNAQVILKINEHFLKMAFIRSILLPLCFYCLSFIVYTGDLHYSKKHLFWCLTGYISVNCGVLTLLSVGPSRRALDLRCCLPLGRNKWSVPARIDKTSNDANSTWSTTSMAVILFSFSNPTTL